MEESTKPYSFTNSLKALDDTYYEYIKFREILYGKTDVENAEDFLTDKMDTEKLECLIYAADESFLREIYAERCR